MKKTVKLLVGVLFLLGNQSCSKEIGFNKSNTFEKKIKWKSDSSRI